MLVWETWPDSKVTGMLESWHCFGSRLSQSFLTRSVFDFMYPHQQERSALITLSVVGLQRLMHSLIWRSHETVCWFGQKFYSLFICFCSKTKFFYSLHCFSLWYNHTVWKKQWMSVWKDQCRGWMHVVWRSAPQQCAWQKPQQKKYCLLTGRKTPSHWPGYVMFQASSQSSSCQTCHGSGLLWQWRWVHSRHQLPVQR